MAKACNWTKVWMLSKELAGRFHGGEVGFSYIRRSVISVPLELALNVRNEVVRLADAHEILERFRSPARRRMPSKSARVSGVTAWSADSSSQASSSDVILKGFSRCSRTERITSLTNWLASAQAPVRTCSFRKASTSLANSTVMLLLLDTTRGLSSLQTLRITARRRVAVEQA